MTVLIHGKIILLTCNQMDCNVKVEHMKGLKRHLAVIHGGGIRYICKLEKCNFETHSKKYLVKHEKKHPDPKYETITESGKGLIWKLKKERGACDGNKYIHCFINFV